MLGRGVRTPTTNHAPSSTYQYIKYSLPLITCRSYVDLPDVSPHVLPYDRMDYYFISHAWGRHVLRAHVCVRAPPYSPAQLRLAFGGRLGGAFVVKARPEGVLNALLPATEHV